MINKLKSFTTFILSVLWLSLILSGYAAAKQLKIGLLEYPPHVVASENGFEGPLLDYLKRMYQDEYTEIVFVDLPNKRGLRELRKGHIDLLFPYIEKGEQIPNFDGALLNVVPGLCFKKKNYIPFLSAPGALNGLNIGIPENIPLVATFTRSSPNLTVIEGSEVLERGVQMLQKGRIDAFYHPSPINVYHYQNPLSKTLACSLFYGFSRPVTLAYSPLLSAQFKERLEHIFLAQLQKQSYEYFLLENK